MGAGGLFGLSIAMSGNTAVIGNAYDDNGFSETGAAYIFSYNGTSWSEVQKIVASDPNGDEYFGSSVSVF